MLSKLGAQLGALPSKDREKGGGGGMFVYEARFHLFIFFFQIVGITNTHH